MNWLGQETLTDDKYFALSFMGASKATAAAYFAATLESSTPEIRHMWWEFTHQLVEAHESLTILALEKGWYHAYGDHKLQLDQAIADSMKVFEPHS